ncbi:MAG: hypothetical protein A2V74_11580 [Acidobacteria bacterium RBG_16_70_10]|nr:MAG: hypothetical protein A2V74_11580 [Acidobacteria bacterium RBG_16_70_10]
MADPATQALASTEIVRPPRKPFYKDPLSIIGWGIALASIVAYWYYFVRKPVPRPGQEIARITAVEGKVKVKPNETEAWNPAKLTDRLHVGDTVQTEPRSGAEVSFHAGSVVRVRPDSIVYIGGSAESSTAAWRVQSGRVNFAIGDQQTEIVTPTLKTTAEKNAAGNIDVGDAGETGVKIFSGEAQIETTQGQVITLAENEAVQVDAQGKAGSKVALPAAPTLVGPEGRAQIPFVPAPGATTRLQWNAVKDGVTYRVAMDYNVVQANLLLSAALDERGLRDTTHELRGLDLGRYFWRVAGVNKDGLEGAFSRVSFFAVVTPAEPTPAPAPTAEAGPPRLVIQPVEALEGALLVQGRTDPRASLTVDGHSIDVRPDGSFAEYIRRGDQTKIVVRATGPDGQFSEQVRPVVEKP